MATSEESRGDKIANLLQGAELQSQYILFVVLLTIIPPILCNTPINLTALRIIKLMLQSVLLSGLTHANSYDMCKM